jgi:acetyltransferase-like isoleucine patch superfamily enzyme
MPKYDPQGFLCYGEDVIISDQSIIKHPHLCRIGSHVAIDNVTFSTAVEIGDYIHVAPYVCTIGGKNSTVILEDFSFVAAGTKIVAGSDDYTGLGLVSPVVPMEFRQVTFSSVTFKKFSGCGVNCTILPGVTLGEGAILGANSLAIIDLEPWTIYVGSPARPIKVRKKETIYEYAKKLGY